MWGSAGPHIALGPSAVVLSAAIEMLRQAVLGVARPARASLQTRSMGGTPPFPYPKKVWSPAGGWWPSPAGWESSTALVALGIFSACVPVFIYSSNRERRPQAPAWRIPSQSWCKHAQEDDPDRRH